MSIEVIQRKGAARFRAVVRIGRKKVSKTFRRKMDARCWESKMRLAEGSPEAIHSLDPSADRDVLFVELMNRFEKEHGELKNAPSTRIMNRSLYENYLAELFGEEPLRKLTHQSIETYFLHLRNDKNISNGRINRIRQLLHVMLNRAVAWGLVPSNPILRVIRLPAKDYATSTEIQFLTKHEADALLEWSRASVPWLYPRIVVLLHSGIRYGEMVALRVGDVRLAAANPHLNIARSRCRHTGAFQLPKGKRGRMIPLSPGFAVFLRTLVEGRHLDLPLLGSDWEENRWPTKFEDHFRRAISETKITRVTPHQLRHTYAVRFLENGGNIYDLKSLLGHTDLKLTMRYAHFPAQVFS